jgi:RimJ/RimL family protein N-acetyltransferase
VATENGSGRGAARAPAEGPRASAFAVERVTHEDVPAICSLYKKVWEADAAGVPVELLKSWQPTALEFTSWMEGVTYFCARREGKVIGVVGLEPYHGSARLVHLGVDPEVRRQGVASALVGAALDWARRGNVRAVWTSGLKRFQGAAALLKQLGFAEGGLLHRHEWGEDVFLFERVL